MHPFVSFTLPSGQRVELHPGDIIGRSDRAALCLDLPFISEAHAMVSLRSGELYLLALRGRLSVDGKASSQVALRSGQRVVLASRTPLTVVEVGVPAEALALESDEMPARILPAVASLSVLPSPELCSGFLPDADAIFWSTGPRLNVRIGDEPTRALERGDELDIRGRRFRVTAIGFEAPSHAPTWDSAEVGTPLHVILNYDTVHFIAGPNRLTLDGISARIVSELAAVRAPVAWQEVAREIWGREPVAEGVLRERWDSSLARLRRKLQAARLRTNLIHTTGAGHIELVLGPGDTVEDCM